jgi:dihydrofolate synthase / folylpolyglutamate synthase
MTVAGQEPRRSSMPIERVRSMANVQALLESRSHGDAGRLVSRHAGMPDRMALCLQALGRPDRAYRTIHVAGTKGKGCTGRLLGALLQRAGLRVGLFTGPHVEHLTERIAVDGSPISDADLVSGFNVLSHLDAGLFRALTASELLTAAALWVFREARVDIAVIEAGTGGRLDATNVINPDLCMITTVGRDHLEPGETLEDIAAAKAGILKPGVPLVCGVSEEAPRDVILARAAMLGLPVQQYRRDYEVMSFLRTGYRGVCSLRVGDTVRRHLVLSTPAPFMAANAAHALAAFDGLARRGVVRELEEPEIREAFGATSSPACCEVFPGRPTVVVDGGHNGMAAAALSEVIRTVFEGRERVLVMGLPRDTDVETVLGRLTASGASWAVFTRAPGTASALPDDLAQGWLKHTGTAGLVEDVPQEAFRRAVDLARGQGVVVVTGSIGLAGVLRPLVRRHAQQPANWPILVG